MDLFTYVDQLSTSELYTLGSSPSRKLNYIFTPKNACSTLKASFLGVDDNPHIQFTQEFLRGPVDSAKPIICVTRNPYDRVLSAFFDKIGPSKDEHVWQSFCFRYDRDPTVQPTVYEFLSIIRRDPEQHNLDLHFRPQHLVNNYSLVRPRFLGRVERMSEVESFLGLHDIHMRNFAPHAHNSSARRLTLSPKELEAIRDIYSLDFQYYGYDTDPLCMEAPPTVLQKQSIAVEFEHAALLRGINSEALIAGAEDRFNQGRLSEARHLLLVSLALDRGNRKKVLEFLSRAEVESWGALSSSRAEWILSFLREQVEISPKSTWIG